MCSTDPGQFVKHQKDGVRQRTGCVLGMDGRGRRVGCGGQGWAPYRNAKREARCRSFCQTTNVAKQDVSQGCAGSALPTCDNRRFAEPLPDQTSFHYVGLPFPTISSGTRNIAGTGLRKARIAAGYRNSYQTNKPRLSTRWWWVIHHIPYPVLIRITPDSPYLQTDVGRLESHSSDGHAKGN